MTEINETHAAESQERPVVCEVRKIRAHIRSEVADGELAELLEQIADTAKGVGVSFRPVLKKVSVTLGDGKKLSFQRVEAELSMPVIDQRQVVGSASHSASEGFTFTGLGVSSAVIESDCSASGVRCWGCSDKLTLTIHQGGKSEQRYLVVQEQTDGYFKRLYHGACAVKLFEAKTNGILVLAGLYEKLIGLLSQHNYKDEDGKRVEVGFHAYPDNYKLRNVLEVGAYLVAENGYRSAELAKDLLLPTTAEAVLDYLDGFEPMPELSAEAKVMADCLEQVLADFHLSGSSFFDKVAKVLKQMDSDPKGRVVSYNQGALLHLLEDAEKLVKRNEREKESRTAESEPLQGVLL